MNSFFRACFGSVDNIADSQFQMKQNDPNPNLFRKTDNYRGEQYVQNIRIVPNKLALKGVHQKPGFIPNYEELGIKEQKYENFLIQTRANPDKWNSVFQEELILDTD